jgi:hypothetical protein
MKRRFLTILTASVLLLGAAGFASQSVEQANSYAPQKELPNAY